MNTLGTPQRPPRAGFTLLEIVITLSLLSTVTLATTLIVVPIARQSRIGREMSVANTEARRVLEQIQATPYNEIVGRFPDGSVYAVGALPSGQVTVQYADPAADPLLIQVQLSWTSPDLGNMSRLFDTVRTE